MLFDCLARGALSATFALTIGCSGADVAYEAQKDVSGYHVGFAADPLIIGERNEATVTLTRDGSPVDGGARDITAQHAANDDAGIRCDAPAERWWALCRTSALHDEWGLARTRGSVQTRRHRCADTIRFQRSRPLIQDAEHRTQQLVLYHDLHDNGRNDDKAISIAPQHLNARANRLGC